MKPFITQIKAIDRIDQGVDEKVILFKWNNRKNYLIKIFPPYDKISLLTSIDCLRDLISKDEDL